VIPLFASGPEAWYIVLFLLCLVISAFFSSSEIAFTALPRYRLEYLLASKVRGAKRVARLIQKPERLLSTVLLGNNLVNTAAAALATAFITTLVQDSTRAVLISTVSVTIILLIFAETGPKIVATHHAERLALANARAIEWISLALTPFVWVLGNIASGVTKVFGGSPISASLASEAEIRAMISAGQKEGQVEEDQAEMLHAVFEFGNRPVREVMVPRLEVASVAAGIKVTEYLAIYAETPFSRFPVYLGNMDNIQGTLSIKDIMMGMAKGNINDESHIDELIRPACYTPETKHIDDLFSEMRENGYQMAVVVDEYGGTAGIVSLGGLVAEIVGPVGDEWGTGEKEFEAIDENTFQIDAGMQIDEANDEMDLGLPEGDYETVAGFIFSRLGHIPKQGEQFKYKGMKIEVAKMRGVKIEEITLTKERPKNTGDATSKN
jgi:putative hemolysin